MRLALKHSTLSSLFPIRHNRRLGADAKQGVSSRVSALRRFFKEISMGQCNCFSDSASRKLWWAAGTGDLGAVEAALARGADVDVSLADGRTPLSHAARKGHEAVAELLIKAGAALNQPSTNGETPLLVAATWGNSGVVRQLLAAGAAVGQANKHGITPLFIAAQNGREVVVGQLLAAGAVVNQTNNNGWTPLQKAERNGHTAVVAILRNVSSLPQTPPILEESLPYATIAAMMRNPPPVLEPSSQAVPAPEEASCDGVTAAATSTAGLVVAPLAQSGVGSGSSSSKLKIIHSTSSDDDEQELCG